MNAKALKGVKVSSGIQGFVNSWREEDDIEIDMLQPAGSTSILSILDLAFVVT